MQRGPPGDPEDEHSRYIEAMVDGIVIGCLYLPNGNPWPGPRFDYKLRWIERLSTRATALLRQDKPVVLAGDYNIIPTDVDVYGPERWIDDALFRPEVRDAFHRLRADGRRISHACCARRSTLLEVFSVLFCAETDQRAAKRKLEDGTEY